MKHLQSPCLSVINLLVLTVFLSIISIAFSSCNRRTAREIVPPSTFAPYVNAYTGGMISAESTIRIALTQALPSVEVNTEVKDDLFDFSPGIKGKAYWIDNKTIEFVPEAGQLKQGKLYRAAFRLDKIMDVDKSLRKFEFTFRVAAKNFIVNVLSTTIKSSSPKLATIDGEIRLSDPADLEKIKKLLQVKIYASQEPNVQIEATEDPTRYTFSIIDIQREDKDLEVKITGVGKALDINKKTEAKLSVPGLLPFKLLYAKTLGTERNAIQVAFSEPLSQEFDLKGFILVNGLSSYTFQQEDNKVNIFFEASSKTDYTVSVHPGIASETGLTLEQSATVSMHIDSYKPQINIPLKGNILPDSKNLLLPFRAVSLSAVDLRIIRIFENNVLSFMQENHFDSANGLRRFGRLIYKKTLRLDSDPEKDLHTWEDYSVDLTDIIHQEPGAIYRVELSFKQDYSVYPCGNSEYTQAVSASDGLTDVLSGELSEDDAAIWDKPETYYYDNGNYDWEIYRWEDRENPCTPSYYMTSHSKASYNLLASNLGLIVKTGADNKMWVAVNNLLDTKPVKDADVRAYNFQLQSIGSAKTDADGFAVIDLTGKAFAVVVQYDRQKTYLKVSDGLENSTSRFDTEGKKINKNLKGFIYGERGVWRPGDTLHVSFILEDKQGKIPDKHPVTMELYNPRGQFYSKQISASGLNGFHTFHISTQAEDPTGLWNLYIKVGGATFHKALRIEAIKPNRLKIALNINGDRIDADKGTVPAKISSSWLTGATAGNLKTTVEMSLSSTNTQFKGYERYQFNNPASNFYSGENKLFEGRLDAEGNAAFSFKTPKAHNAPGMLNANIICRVMEPGGDASIYTQNIPFSPFNSYVGVNLNNSKEKYIETDQDHPIDVVTLSPDGKQVNRTLHYKIYKLNWSWWWESKNESFESYVNNTSTQPVSSGNLTTSGGKATFHLRINYPDWGRYLVYVKDSESGHASGGVVYVDWPNWRGRSSKSDPSGVTMLTFSTDKTSYEVGEEVTVIVPASANGRALMALENGSAVLSRHWIEVSSSGDTQYKFKVTADMAPNFYLHISLLQPHEQTVNDLPIRMYGIVPVSVTNKQLELTPQISMPDVLRPEKTFEVKIKEKDGKPMTYTLAVVDDGLLDLTNFKTPNPQQEFNAREALGIRTWDMYDWVIGAFGGKYTPLFSVGGDESGKPANQKANRFKPVVRFIGPFALKSGENTHKIQLPMYVGSVRVMVVAGQNGAYGKAEKTAPVRSPLMLLSTLPRVVSTGEEILLPVNIFAMEKEVNQVTVKVETSGKLKLTDGHTKTLKFSKPGDAMAFFPLQSNASTGMETVSITATGNGLTATEKIEIEIRNPNPSSVTVQDTLLAADSETQFDYSLGDQSGENWMKLEVSRIPSVDISRRIDFLYDYPHYCSEQLTSRALPLLFISQFKDIDKEEEEKIKTNVREAIKNLYGRQMNNGGFVYWPGDANVNEWITSYAGNFLVEAQRKGYEVNPNVLKKWKDYQRKAAQNWSPDYQAKSRYAYQAFDLQQAYRLYTLALANAPEVGAMNRMKEMKELSLSAKWRLAAAYAINGKTKAANEVIWNLQTTVEPYSPNNATYGDYGRDEAMILETMVLTGNMQEAFRQAQKVSKNLSQESYFSTQSTAFSLVAMGRLAEKTEKGIIDFEWSINGKSQQAVKTGNAVYQISLPVDIPAGNINIRNTGKGDLYVNLAVKTRPVIDRQPVVSNNLKLDVTYEDLSGSTVSVNSLRQGMDFVARVRVSNISGTTDYTDLALTHIVPSGWEIFNERMANHDNPATPVATNYLYQDIRDDRVLTYFDLGRGLSKTFRIRLQAAYAGKFILPAILCEAMYDTSAQARTVAGNVQVVK
ncbi:MAG: alpha-2-macroglobulin [Dysgonamonadaceae bacterium]|nr:alpha-2-macroglobulin [Dysgonamonadaceae bacterium]